MPRKTTENTTAKRSKKTAAAVQPAAVPVAAEAGQAEVVKTGFMKARPVKAEPAREVRKRKNGKAAGLVVANLEEAIRRRAYELYLERRATAGDESGDENQDWLIAEREVLARHNGQGQHTA